ncbi:MAG: PAS domain S-box protein, partial [Candidatus Lindowbacteria bacterium]|nr:PAS domain S-box protein [Candidatus Lindowbacteria bacterium]
AEGTIQYVNPAFETVTGYTREGVIGQNPRLLKSGEQDEVFYQKLWETITSGKTWEGRFVNKKKDGARYTEDATISPVHGNDGAITNYVAVKRDMTEHLRLHDEKEKLQAQLVQAQKMESVGRLAGGVAHDFNNMLTAILGYSALELEKAQPDSSLHNSLTEIQKAAQRSADLTRQLLAFARKQTVSPEVLDLNDAVSGMLKMLRRLIGEDIDLAWMPGHDLWKVRIDPSQVDQILANLTVNARDAIAGVGKLTIDTANAVFDEPYCADRAGFIPGEYAQLAVSDDGAGMSKDILEHIFAPFFTTKGVGKGTGLGLATVYGIVKQNDGFINVYSEPGQGTTFKIYLPRFEVEPVQVAARRPEIKPRGGTETVLLVEDEGAILKLGEAILNGLGYTVLAARAPSHAIRLAGERTGDIHLLITDVVMPEMNGRELAERLSAIKPGLKCLYMSGYTANVIAHRGVLEEGVHFVQKPFSLEMLAAKVRETLDS